MFYQLDARDCPIRFQPWLGDAFAFLYNFFMVWSVFPKKFNADIDLHKAILSQELQHFHNQQILELGTGAGSAAAFLPPDNTYIGTDISTGLLKQALIRFRRAGFQDPKFYVASADDLPFVEGSLDLCLCILSLNFIGNHKKVLEGVYALLRSGGKLTACVPVPERTPKGSPIHGNLLSEVRLKKLCGRVGFNFEPIDAENGALLYFRATKSGDHVSIE